MSRLTITGSALTIAAAMTGACTSSSSATDLMPEGPPMVRQLIMNELITDAQGITRVSTSLAFGDHPDFDTMYPGDDRVVTAGSVNVNNHLRVIIDELLIGNNLEQIACRDGSFQSVPEGTTPDDIARCAVADDILSSTCTGPHAVCLDADGAPIGVQDEVPTGGDGAADDTQFIAGIVHVDCSGIDVPLDIANTFYQPAGNQQVPAAGGFNSVGPAIVIATTRGFPTSSDCSIDIADSVVDKDHIPVCAPPGGGFVDGEIDPSVDCAAAGDTSLLAWSTEPLRVPANGTFPMDGATNVALTSGGSANARITVQFNTTIASVDVSNIELLEDTTARTDITAALDPNDDKTATITVPGGYVANTQYTLTIGAGAAQDTFGIDFPAAQERTIHFTTAP